VCAEVAVGLGSAAPDGSRGPQEAFGEFRRCLRPDACPYAQGATTALPVAAPEVWGAALADLLPGDPDLAWEIADLLVAEGILGEDDELDEAEELLAQ
jgi:hypothetical protein